SLFIVRASDGRIVAQQRLRQVVYPGGNHHALELGADDTLEVGIYEHPDPAYVKIEGLAGKRPRFRLISQPKPVTDQRFLPDGTPNPRYRMPPRPSQGAARNLE